ncbi:hypothetical protein N2152v2_004794 [Parachlorella kessleri]
MTTPLHPGYKDSSATSGKFPDQLPPQRLDVQELETNVWAYKPAWCQPWSILSSGTAVVAGVWAISGGSTAWTAASALPVMAWWYLFLGVYPAQFREYAETVNDQQRQQASSGEVL